MTNDLALPLAGIALILSVTCFVTARRNRQDQTLTGIGLVICTLVFVYCVVTV